MILNIRKKIIIKKLIIKLILMEVKMNSYNCYKNIKNELDKKNINKKIQFNNVIKSSQKSNSKISLFTQKKSNNKNNKKEKNFNMKEITPMNLKKPLSSKKDIIKEKQEKAKNIILGNDKFKSKGRNNITNKNTNIFKNKNKETKKKIYYNNIDNLDIKKLNNNKEKKIITSIEKSQIKDSIYDSPVANQITEDDLVTSFERKPSELKSPETISEGSFISEEEENNNNKKQTTIKDKVINKNIEKEVITENKEYNLIEQHNEIKYIDKIKDLETDNLSKEFYEGEEKGEMKNKNSNEINNIKVNIKTSFFNEKEKNILNKPKIVKDFNKGEKIINEKNINPKNQNSKNYNDKINIIEKKKYNINSNKTIGSYVPVIQKCITVKKNQVLSNNIETKYNRNTSKNSQIEYLEPIKELQNNFSNQSLKIVDTKFVNINKNKYNHKINKIEKTKLNKNLSQIDDKYEDVIFHKKLKMDKEKKDEYQKKILKI